MGCQPSRTNLLTNPMQKTYFTEMPVSVFILSKNTSEELNTPVLGYLFAGNSACTKQKTKQNIKAVCNKGPDQRDAAVRLSEQFRPYKTKRCVSPLVTVQAGLSLSIGVCCGLPVTPDLAYLCEQLIFMSVLMTSKGRQCLCPLALTATLRAE